MNTKLTANQITKFLNLYENNPCLWDVGSDLYNKDRDCREQAYRRIVENMNIEIDGFNATSTKLKIRSIRNSYSLELAKITKSKRSGAGTEDIYKPNVAWNPVVQIRNTQSTEMVNIFYNVFT